ncbi:Transcriptional regulator, LacI family [Fimbriimonas ginsengisoli Gsoil 348]|uniref:Transcriptional regulator, LacI family n=2 Tax=Fimbriimonas ginsengisoli TaxID=1005039 RepID=A0A068NRN4_FIMGI|nr:Transcriptional regulator, LacI family [Fimbriimonas ginsengisoli Gsoil 348]
MAVSVVLNGTGGRKVTVAPEKAERIREIARELRYQPNHVARTFRSGRTAQVAVVFQNFGHFRSHSSYRGDVMNGVMDALFPEGYTLSLCPKLMDERHPDAISDGRFDGVLWCRPDLSDASATALQHARVPVVMMHAPAGTVLGVPTFCADNEGAMRRVVAHLVSLGHEKLAFVIDPVSEHSIEGQSRAEALKSAARRVGLQEPDVIVLGQDHRILSRYAEPDAPHTALVCFSDELAGFVLKSCEQFGIDVPGHVSVVGFDSSPLCETTRPRLTSVAQPVERMAFEATTHLLSLIRAAEEGKPSQSATSTLYDCVLDIRESTAPPPAH